MNFEFMSAYWMFVKDFKHLQKTFSVEPYLFILVDKKGYWTMIYSIDNFCEKNECINFLSWIGNILSIKGKTIMKVEHSLSLLLIFRRIQNIKLWNEKMFAIFRHQDTFLTQEQG